MIALAALGPAWDTRTDRQANELLSPSKGYFIDSDWDGDLGDLDEEEEEEGDE